MNDAMESISTVMPLGTLEGSAAWYGCDYQHRTDWIYQLSTVEIEEIDVADGAAKTVGRDIIGVSRDNFDLPTLGDKLRIVRNAFRTMMEICEEMHLSIDYQAGDMRLVNNHKIFHARSDYEEWPDADRRRYLLRLWLCPPNG
jgi:hypothetical protein